MDVDGDLIDEIIIEAKHGVGLNHYIEDLRIFKDNSPNLKLIFTIRTLDSYFGLKYPDNHDDISEIEFTEPSSQTGLREIIVKTTRIYYKDSANKIADKKESLETKVFKWNGKNFIKKTQKNE